MGFFHGLLGRAISDSPGQESDWLTMNNAGLAWNLIIVLPFDAVASLVTLGR